MQRTKKRILVLCSSAQKGGAEISLALWLQHVDKQKYDFLVLLPDKGPLFKALEAIVPVDIAPISSLKRSGFLKNGLRQWSRLREGIQRVRSTIQEFRPDLILANSTQAFLYGGLAGRREGVSTIWYVRDSPPAPWPLNYILGKWANRIICNSQFVQAGLPLSAKSKSTVVFNAVANPQPSAHNIREELGLAPHTFLIAQIGQVIPWKRHIDLIEVAPTLVKRFPHLCFLIIGADLFQAFPDYLPRLQQMVKAQQLENHFYFLGHREDTESLLAQIDVLVHPARTEPFGRVVIEAMNHGKAVVAIKQGGPAEIIQHDQTGLLTPPGDLAALASAIATLIEDSDKRQQLGEAAQKVIWRQFRINQQVVQLDEILRSIPVRSS